MKKIIFLIVIVAVAGWYLWRSIPEKSLPSVSAPAKTAQSGSKPSDIPAVASYKDATYTIEGESVHLVAGHESEAAAPGSAATVDTDYFGNEATGDLNGDGSPDIAFIVTQSGGGTGIFFYAVAAIRTPSGYIGTNAVFLGDRIAPQATEIRNGTAIFNYAERRETDPMTEAPSVGASKYLKFDSKSGRLIETAR